MILTAPQLVELTGRARSDAQRRALDFMGVPYRVRPDGSPVVLAAHLEALPGGGTMLPAREPELQP